MEFNYSQTKQKRTNKQNMKQISILVAVLLTGAVGGYGQDIKEKFNPVQTDRKSVV